MMSCMTAQTHGFQLHDERYIMLSKDTFNEIFDSAWNKMIGDMGDENRSMFRTHMSLNAQEYRLHNDLMYSPVRNVNSLLGPYNIDPTLVSEHALSFLGQRINAVKYNDVTMDMLKESISEKYNKLQTSMKREIGSFKRYHPTHDDQSWPVFSQPRQNEPVSNKDLKRERDSPSKHSTSPASPSETSKPPLSPGSNSNDPGVNPTEVVDASKDSCNSPVTGIHVSSATENTENKPVSEQVSPTKNMSLEVQGYNENACPKLPEEKAYSKCSEDMDKLEVDCVENSDLAENSLTKDTSPELNENSSLDCTPEEQKLKTEKSDQRRRNNSECESVTSDCSMYSNTCADTSGPKECWALLNKDLVIDLVEQTMLQTDSSKSSPRNDALMNTQKFDEDHEYRTALGTHEKENIVFNAFDDNHTNTAVDLSLSQNVTKVVLSKGSGTAISSSDDLGDILKRRIPNESSLRTPGNPKKRKILSGRQQGQINRRPCRSPKPKLVSDMGLQDDRLHGVQKVKDRFRVPNSFNLRTLLGISAPSRSLSSSAPYSVTMTTPKANADSDSHLLLLSGNNRLQTNLVGLDAVTKDRLVFSGVKSENNNEIYINETAKTGDEGCSVKEIQTSRCCFPNSDMHIKCEKRPCKSEDAITVNVDGQHSGHLSTAMDPKGGWVAISKTDVHNIVESMVSTMVTDDMVRQVGSITQASFWEVNSTSERPDENAGTGDCGPVRPASPQSCRQIPEDQDGCNDCNAQGQRLPSVPSPSHQANPRSQADKQAEEPCQGTPCTKAFKWKSSMLMRMRQEDDDPPSHDNVCETSQEPKLPAVKPPQPRGVQKKATRRKKSRDKQRRNQKSGTKS